MPLGLLSLSSYLAKYSSHRAKVVDLAYYIKNKYVNINKDFYKNCAEFLLNKFPSDVYGFSTIVTGEIPSVQIAKELKKINSQIKIILGNQWASLNDLEVLKFFPHIDYIVRGEGEETLLELLDVVENNCELGNVKGISYLDNFNPRRNEDRKMIADLDDIPPIDMSYSYPQFKEYNRSGYGGYYGMLEFGRGCPFSCSFCSTTIHWNRSVRTFSIKRTIDDIKRLQNYGFDFIEFTYDNFGTRRGELIEFCHKLIVSNVNIRWSIRCRLDCLDGEAISMLKQAGCVSILVGLESGAQAVIEKIGKKLDFKEALKTVELLIKEGIRVCGSFVTGLPYERDVDIHETLKMAAILRTFGKLTHSEIHFHSPLPGTKDTDEAIKSNTLKFPKSPYVSPDFSRYLEWVPLISDIECIDANPRFSEDQTLIYNNPQLFTSYGYINNLYIPPERFTALSTYINLILQFYPITVAALLDVAKIKGVDFIEDIEDFALSHGWDREQLFKLRVEINYNIKIGCPDRIKPLVDLFQHYFISLDRVPNQIKNIFRYENTLLRFSLQEKNKLFNKSKPNKVVSDKTILIPNVIVEEFDYNIQLIINKIRSGFFSNNTVINWNDDIEEGKYLFAFEAFEDSGDYYAGVKIYKIGEAIYSLFSAADGTRTIADLVRVLYDAKEERIYHQILEQVLSFLQKNDNLWRDVI